MSNKIVIDRDTFSALASDTRIDILKELDERRKTLSELSRSLDTNKSAVYKHLNKLTDVGLIKKEEDTGHKWKYYQLTWRGKHLLHPQKMKIRVLLSGAGAAAAAAVIAAYRFLQEKQAAAPQTGPGILGTGGAAEADPTMLYLAFFFAILGALLVVGSMIVRQKGKQAEYM
ncbi:MAG: winged helix-turn-helix domain-containing protein [Thermoplasmatota archaeon]